MDPTPSVIIPKANYHQKLARLLFLFGIINILFASFIFIYFKDQKAKIKPLVAVETEFDLGKDTVSRFPQNYFLPKEEILDNAYNWQLTAKAYAVMDRESGEILSSKNLKMRLPIASITKIMTVIIALEHTPLDEIFFVSPYASAIGEATMGLTMGEKLTLEELLYGAMLPSGNDAAQTIAEGVGSYVLKKNNSFVSRDEASNWFILRMNKQASQLGMRDTHFVNPTGLDEETKDKSSYSTAFDLLTLARFSLENNEFTKIASTKSKIIPEKKGEHKRFLLENILQLDGSFQGLRGIKPGNSIFAKETLVSYAEREGRKIIVILLGSQRTKDDALQIYKQIFDIKPTLKPQFQRD